MPFLQFPKAALTALIVRKVNKRLVYQNIKNFNKTTFLTIERNAERDFS